VPQPRTRHSARVAPAGPAGAALRTVFHGVENRPEIFPYRGKNGKNFSMAWKTREKFFHTVENPACVYYS